MQDTLIVALGQAETRPGNLNQNIERAAAWAKEASAKGATLLCLPELFDYGYDLSAIGKLGPQAGSLKLGEAAIAHNISIAAGIAYSDGGARNSLVLFHANGQREAYNKIHLFEAAPNIESD